METITDEKNEFKATLDGYDLSIANAIVEKLLKNKEIAFAAADYDHPLKRRVILTVNGKNAKKEVLKAINEVKNDVAEFADKLGKVLAK